ncbi:MAG: hypothetical protein ACOCWI_03525 [Bacillota bacterium]
MEEKKQPLELSFAKEQLKDLQSLMIKSDFTDEENLWLGGFLNFKVHYNAVLENLLSGKKKMKFLAKNKDDFYLLKVDGDKIVCYKTFVKEDVAEVVTGIKLLSKAIKVVFKDEDEFSIDVTANKDKVKEFKKLLK